MNRISVMILLTIGLMGCGPSEPRPVELFPEDECGLCRMAISERPFASEIIMKDGTVHKFDDIRCLRNMHRQLDSSNVAAIFYIDYDTGKWLASSEAILIETGIHTPMGSGVIAVGRRERADEILKIFPAGE